LRRTGCTAGVALRLTHGLLRLRVNHITQPVSQRYQRWDKGDSSKKKAKKQKAFLKARSTAFRYATQQHTIAHRGMQAHRVG
jgi:hypothetical protein